MIMKKLVLFLVSFTIISTLSSCTPNNLEKTSDYTGSISELKFKDYTDPLKDAEGITDAFGLRAFSDAPYDQYKTIYLSNEDSPILLKFNQAGANRNIRLTAFLDYRPIKFSVSNKNNELVDKYTFSINSSQLVELPIFLNIDERDEKTHKLMFSFVTEKLSVPDTTTRLGITSVYDLCFTKEALNRESSVEAASVDIIDAENYFDFTTIDLVLNTDYKNAMQTNERRVANPPHVLDFKQNEEFSLVYNVSNPLAYKSALLLLTIDGMQVPINGQEYLYLNLEKDSMANGSILMNTPIQEGEHEIIGYVIYEPFSYTTGTKSDLASTSQRTCLRISQTEG